MQSRVLIVDDDAEMRQALELVFSADGHGCQVAADAMAALSIVEQQTLDVVVSDVLMDGMDGLELLDRVRQTHPALPFIVVTAAGGIQQAVDAVKRGAFEYLVKPFDADTLRQVVAKAVDGRRHPGEPGRMASSPPPAGKTELVGSGAAMRALQTTIDFVARSSAPVLVIGETGVGKELVARAVHARGPRRNAPFIAVNTSAIPQELLEGELFGHARGAFTGAIHQRKGLVTEADGGTLLLDEIGEMSPGLQAKLLRVLQSGEVRPVGSDRTHHVDVRIIAATHRDLPALVKEGRFREDLFYRLDVLPVFVPPLRDRPEDIPALAQHFLAQACERAPLSPVRKLGLDALSKLAAYSWPGNVRQLASSIERAVVFGVDEMIDAEQLGAVTSVGSACSSDSRLPPGPFPVHEPWTLRHLSRAYTEWVLAQTSGDKERAAAILGIDLSTLYRWRRARTQ